ncbi:YbaK/EbsC family protein [Chitinophaga sp.]|uniref:prolyl-tRNA synthetase associated domain-containing protein n=1 Tax=Chitinophaga sp. TaxID=1869181 RepID=UPI0031DE499E
MFYISEIQTTAPAEFITPLQELVYTTLRDLHVPFERVDTDEAITMEDCKLINAKLNVEIVKTLFLCNRQQTNFYLFVTTADKPFVTKDFSSAVGIPRVSFAPVALLNNLLGTPVGGATIFGILLDKENKVQVLIDKDVLNEKWYGCSDGTPKGYMKISRDWITHDFLKYTGHTPAFIEV